MRLKEFIHARGTPVCLCSLISKWVPAVYSRITQPKLPSPIPHLSLYSLQIGHHKSTFGALVCPMRESMERCSILLGVHVVQVVGIPDPITLQVFLHVVECRFHLQYRHRCELHTLVITIVEPGNSVQIRIATCQRFVRMMETCTCM